MDQRKMLMKYFKCTFDGPRRMGPISYKPAARLRNQRRWPSDLLPGTRLHCQAFFFSREACFNYSVYQRVHPRLADGACRIYDQEQTS